MDLHQIATDWSFCLTYFAPRIGLAVLCGMVIGLEREIKKRPAGLRTLILICLGSTVFTSFTEVLAIANNGSDNTRILSQIIQGIGFLGAGVIWQSGDKVYGLTTASVIWVMAGIGAVIGLGFFPLAVILTATVFLVLTLFTCIEKRVK